MELKKKESEVSFDNTALSNNYGLLDRDDPRDLPITQYGFDKDSNGDLIYDTPLQTQHWLCSKQGKERANFRGTCGLCSCANIIRLSGVHMSEGDIIDYASTTHAPNSVNMLCEVGNMIPSANGGTSPEDRKTILEHFGISSGIYRIEKNADGSISNNNIQNIGHYVSEGRGVILSVHAYHLWYDRPNTINDFHAVTVTSVKKTQDGQILGFCLHDTGRGETNYYSAERLRRALTGSPMNVTHQIIR